MANSISDDDWEEFIEIVATSIKGHQEPAFIETVALALRGGVYNKYQNWKYSPDGIISTMDMKVRYVLTQWKGCQTHRDLHFLVDTFDSLLSKDKFSNELRTTLTAHFKDRAVVNGGKISSTSPTHVQPNSKPDSNLPTIGTIHGNAIFQMGAGNNENANQGVGSFVGNANQVSGMQGTTPIKTNSDLNPELKKKDVHNTKDRLFELMKEEGIDDLYDKFQENGISAEILWDLSDDILDKDLQLSRIQKLKYDKAKRKHS